MNEDYESTKKFFSDESKKKAQIDAQDAADDDECIVRLHEERQRFNWPHRQAVQFETVQILCAK